MSDNLSLDYSLFQRLLKNMLKMNVYEYLGDHTVLRNFETNYYLYPPFQPMFTAEALENLLDHSQNDTIYDISDELGACITFFRFSDRVYLLGPYVKNHFNESAAQQLLLKHHLAASLLLPMKHWYAQLPQINDYYVEESIRVCISSFLPETSVLYFKHLQGIQENPVNSVSSERSRNLLDTIYRRYELENDFMDSIRRGDVRAVSASLSHMFQDDFCSELTKPIFTPVYQNPLSIIRILARKAAEDSGLSVLTIDYITQKSVQKMASARYSYDSHRYIMECVTELTQAVHDYLYRSEKFSPLISKAMEYLDMNYAENVSVQEVCQYLGISVSSLSKTFKAETGKTLTQMLAYIRCLNAAELLKNSSLSIQEISSYVGYLDNNYFIKVFKKQYCMTPSEYRSSQKN